MTSWSDWKANAREAPSPYLDWSLKMDAYSPWQDQFAFQLSSDAVLDLDTMRPALVQSSAAAGYDNRFPVPSANNNPGFGQYLATHPGKTWLPGSRDLPAIGTDDIIVGVIDVDTGLGHQAFRAADGSSRVLAAWQQGATWSNQQHLPFGQEKTAAEINALLAAHSRESLTGRLDQEAFDNALQLVDLTRPEATKGLAERTAHGTHVMGLAAGANPALDPDFSQRVKLLVVNLPPEFAYGEGGGFLDNYLIYGMAWILETYHHLTKVAGHDVPLAINISFGKQAGPKEDSSGLFRAYHSLRQTLEIADDARLSVFLPAGNDNLTRCNALIELGPNAQASTAEDGDVKELSWRVQPADSTSNIVEIWSEFCVCPEQEAPFLIDVVPPGGVPGDFRVARHGDVRDLVGGLGRIYCDVLPSHDGHSFNIRYQICLSPDRIQNGAQPGLWRIRLRNNCDSTLSLRAAVQTDQATLPGRREQRRSYFEDDDYVMFEPTGRLADTAVYGSDPIIYSDRGSTVTRKGTLNSYASQRFVVVGGFQSTDGRPALYSSSALGRKRQDTKITVALPSDDGAVTTGVMSLGAQEGSVVAQRGTSFACASAARLEVERWIQSQTAQSSLDALKQHATTSEAHDFSTYPKGAPEKVGSGRISFRSRALRVDRM